MHCLWHHKGLIAYGLIMQISYPMHCLVPYIGSPMHCLLTHIGCPRHRCWIILEFAMHCHCMQIQIPIHFQLDSHCIPMSIGIPMCSTPRPHMQQLIPHISIPTCSSDCPFQFEKSMFGISVRGPCAGRIAGGVHLAGCLQPSLRTRVHAQLIPTAFPADHHWGIRLRSCIRADTTWQGQIATIRLLRICGSACRPLLISISFGTTFRCQV